MQEREENSFERKSNDAETKLPLNEELHVQVDIFADKYDMRPKDALRQFLKLGLKCNKAVEKGYSEIFLKDKDDTETPLFPFPVCSEEEVHNSKKPTITEARLNLYQKEKKELRRVAKKNNILIGQVLDNFVEFGLQVVDIMERTDSRIVFRDKKGQEDALIFIPIKKRRGRSR